MSKLSKLTNFAENAMNNLSQCLGGVPQPTYHGGVADDSYDLATGGQSGPNGGWQIQINGQWYTCDFGWTQSPRA
jgi:hypothetical protein